LTSAPVAVGATEAVRIEHLDVQFEHEGVPLIAVEDLSLAVRDQEFLAIVGPSGCGKSTLLNVLVGTLRPSAGRVFVNQEEVLGINRSVGYVTQDDNLLPWRTLLSNIELPLELRGVGVAARRARARDALRRVGLEAFEAHFPHQLSGGMRQRANIVRTLVYDPSLIVMDEPFGSLDAFTRSKMHRLVLDLWEGARKTIVFITHDLDEAIVLADRVAVMSRRPGHIKATVEINLPRPRDPLGIKATDAFHHHFANVWGLLAEEVGD
jgi:NitT/TauT family transport system ATP-binding protein